MSQAQVLDVVRRTTVEVLGDIDPASVTLEGTLSDLGANSIDRMEIVTLSMEELGVVVPPAEFSRIKDLRSLVELLTQYTQ